MENGKYICEECSYNTTRKFNMERHLFKHSDMPVCRICNAKFVDSINLKSHMVTAHGQGGDAKACCSLCGENFLTLNSLRRHKQFVHERKAKYHCKACDLLFDSRSRFDAHMSKHTGVAPHSCGRCGRGYRFKKNLLQHTHICTGKMLPYEKKDGRLHCRKCGYSSQWHTDIKRHGYQHNPEDKHACSLCEKSYCSLLELQEHTNSAHLNLKFLCYWCGKKFNSRRALNRHASHVHENIYKYTCQVCAKRFYDKVKFDDHKDKHTGAKNHVCHVCGLAYRYKPRLITHLKLHASSESFSCKMCSQMFNTAAALKKHLCGKHSVNQQYRCPWCSKEFRWSSSLSFHKRKTSSYTKILGKYRCSLCSYCTTRKYDINTHCQKHKQRTYTCKDCEITYETRQALQRHLNLNHKQQACAFPCPVCSSVYGYKSELEEHMLQHPGKWLHHCPKCEKGFSKQEYLTQHLKRCGRQRFTENNEYGKQGKMFFCKLCSYKTEWSTSIKRHRFTHTVVGKPTCEICSKSYCCEGDLRDHMNVAHANAKFLCYQCGKEFSCRSSLLRHTQVTHELKYKYKCDVCSQQFTDKRKMADHMDKHTGVRNHICHICGMAYRYRPRLAVHLRRHQNPEPLQCEYCKKTFKNSDTLRVHIMGKHLDRKYPCPYCGKDFIWHKSMSHHKKRCRSRPHNFSNEDIELLDEAAAPPEEERPEEEEEMLDERTATDMVIQAAAEAVKAEPPPTSNPWKVYQIPTYSSNAHSAITVSNLSGLPISNFSGIPMSHLPNFTASGLNSTSMSNFVHLSDVSGSNLTVQGLSSLPVATYSSLPVSSMAELPMVGISNGQTSTAGHLTVSSMSNLPASTMSNQTITTLSNVPVSSLTSVPMHMSNLSNVPVTNMSNIHMNLTPSSLHTIVTQGLPNEWKVDSTTIPVYVKDY